MPFTVQIFIGQGQGTGSAVIPDATPTNAGIMTAEQAAALANVQSQVWAWKVVTASMSPYTALDTDTALACDTSTAALVTVDIPSGMPEGKVYVIYDKTGNCKVHPITINLPAGSLVPQLVLSTAAFESVMFIIQDDGSAALIAEAINP